MEFYLLVHPVIYDSENVICAPKIYKREKEREKKKRENTVLRTCSIEVEKVDWWTYYPRVSNCELASPQRFLVYQKRDST